MSKKASQLAFITFSGKVNNEEPYTYNYKNFVKEIKSLRKDTKGGTMTSLALNAASKILKRDPNSRLKNPNVQKLVFVLTDGGQESLYEIQLNQSINALHSLGGVSVYSIATQKISYNKEYAENQLKQIASKPEYVKFYDTTSEFKTDIADIVYKTCQIPISYKPVDSDYLMSDSSSSSQDITISKLSFGERRVFELKFAKDMNTVIKFKTKKLEINEYASFRQRFPNKADFDFKKECAAKKTCELTIKNPESFVPEFCQTGDYGDSVHVTIEAVGPKSCEQSSCTEDVDASATQSFDRNLDENSWKNSGENGEEHLLSENSGDKGDYDEKGKSSSGTTESSNGTDANGNDKNQGGNGGGRKKGKGKRYGSSVKSYKIPSIRYVLLLNIALRRF